tara:strand:- start:71 stop:244 length:174 start_codon:yes stop_codon:yes gene_type:complete
MTAAITVADLIKRVYVRLVAQSALVILSGPQNQRYNQMKTITVTTEYKNTGEFVTLK